MVSIHTPSNPLKYSAGVMKIVSSMHEGFHNLPEMYGSEVRQEGRVTDFSSGLKEAGKVGFFMSSMTVP